MSTAPRPSHSLLALRIPPVAVTLFFGGLAWLLARACPALSVAWAPRAWFAAGLAAAGVGVSLGGVLSFRRARTTVNPLRPETTTALVTSGLYRVTRNPMYLGFLLFLLAGIALLAHPLALLAAPAFVFYLNRFQIEPEERALAARFPVEFRAYEARVRRWL